jgi:hypothetical protein
MMRSFQVLLAFLALLTMFSSDAAPQQTGNPDPVAVRLHRSSGDPFAARSWVSPSVVLPPETPKAPPLPFVYLGKMFDGKAVTAFVSMGANTHLLHSGDTVRDYRVEAINAREITFVYLPLNQKQRLSLGSEN